MEGVNRFIKWMRQVNYWLMWAVIGFALLLLSLPSAFKILFSHPSNRDLLTFLVFAHVGALMFLYSFFSLVKLNRGN